MRSRVKLFTGLAMYVVLSPCTVAQAQDGVNGYRPRGVTVAGTNVYGVSAEGGANGDGTLWSYDTLAGTFNKVHDFRGAADGASPIVVQALSESELFGISFAGDPSGGDVGCGPEGGCGTYWTFNTDTDELRVLHDIRPDDGYETFPVRVSGNKVFGAAGRSSRSGRGTLWSLDLESVEFDKLLQFDETETYGMPVAIDIAVSGTTIFGVSTSGGAHDSGVLFSFDTSSRVLEKLHDFGVHDSSRPTRLAVSSNTIYGYSSGESIDDATLWSFDMATDEFAKLHDFDRSDGVFPIHFTVSESMIHGVATAGGANGGTFWSFDLSRNTFDVIDPSSLDMGFDIAVSGDNYYGTNIFGGKYDGGVFWTYDASTDVTTILHEFRTTIPEPSSVLPLIFGAAIVLAKSRCHRK